MLAKNLFRILTAILIVGSAVALTGGKHKITAGASTAGVNSPRSQSEPGSHFEKGDQYLDLFRAGGKAQRTNFEIATGHYIKGLELGTGDIVYYTNRLGYAYHL